MRFPCPSAKGNAVPPRKPALSHGASHAASLDTTGTNFPQGVQKEPPRRKTNVRAGAERKAAVEKGTPKCPNGTLVLQHPPAAKLVPSLCRKWNCPSCGPRKARRLRKRLSKTRPNRLVTLTLRPEPGLSPRDHLAIANRAWSVIWRRLRRKHGPKAAGYAKIVELTKAGTPHLHIIVDCPWIEQRWLSAAWRDLTGSFIVDVRAVTRKRGIAGYLTAYLTKALEVPPGMRKWSASRQWVPPEESPPLEPGEIPPSTSWTKVEIEHLEAAYLGAGYRYVDGWLIPPEVPLETRALAPPVAAHAP